MGIPDSIRVRFERPCPEDDVQCGQHGSSGFLWASVCLHCGGKVHQWCVLRVRVLGWLVVEFRVEQSQQQNPRYGNIANIANIAQKVTKPKEYTDSSCPKTTWHVSFCRNCHGSHEKSMKYDKRQRAAWQCLSASDTWHMA